MSNEHVEFKKRLSHSKIEKRREALIEIVKLKKFINPICEQNTSILKKIDEISTQLEISPLPLNETYIAEIIIAAFNAGKEKGKKEFQEKIATL